jgi:hypothetical protein
VKVKGDTFAHRTTVTAVGPDGKVELEDPIPKAGMGKDLRIAQLLEDDPLDRLGSRLLGEWRPGVLGDGQWLNYVLDPRGALLGLAHPRERSFWWYLLRVINVLTGPSAWSSVIPGWFIWDNAFKQLDGEAYMSCMEQDASESSGSLYSLCGRLRESTEYVGDLARYVYFADDSQVHTTDLQDAPGTHLQPLIRVIPHVDKATPNAALDLNQLETATPVAPATLPEHEPAHALPDDLFAKDAGDPREVDQTATRSCSVTVRGSIPSTGALRYSEAAYIGFSRAGTHRITVADSISDSFKARSAQDKGKQDTYFAQTVKDVTVQIGGVSVADATPPATLSLLVTQRAAVTVEPSDGRSYALRVLRPTQGTLLRAPDPLTLEARNVVGDEAVQIDRIYRIVGVDRYADDFLNRHGVHLPRPLRIPVRRLTVSVVNVLPFRGAPSSAATSVIASTQPGTAYLLVPTDVLVDPTFTFTPAPPTVPQVSAARIDTPAGAAAFVGGGVVFRVTFGAPEDQVTVNASLRVGSAGNEADVTASVELRPSFQITDAAGNFQVSRSAGAPKRFVSSSPFPVIGATVDRPFGVTVTFAPDGDNWIDIQADAAATLGPMRLTVTVQSDIRDDGPPFPRPVELTGVRTLEIIP